MHQRLRCAGHGNVDLICPFGRRFGKLSRRGIGGEWGVAAVLRRRAWRQGLSALPRMPDHGAILDLRQMAGYVGPTTCANARFGHCTASQTFLRVAADKRAGGARPSQARFPVKVGFCRCSGHSTLERSSGRSCRLRSLDRQNSAPAASLKRKQRDSG